MRKLGFTLAALVLLLAGCGDDAGVQVEQVWARPTAPTATNAAFYATITNQSAADDQLVAFSSPSCDEIELHRSEMTDGVMRMRPADAADSEILDGHTRTLAPGGLHLMCLGLREPLIEGETTKLDLTFINGGDIVVEVAIENR